MVDLSVNYTLTHPRLGYIGRALGNPDVDWMLKSTPQKSLKGRTVPLAR